MGKVAVLVPWLQRLFPPAEQPGAQPLEVSGDISLVHNVFTGTEDLPSELSATLGAAGVSSIILVGPRDNEYVIVHAAQYSHNDATARVGSFRFHFPGGIVSAENGIPVSTAQNEIRGYGRTILVPPGASLGVQVAAIGGAQAILGTVGFTRVLIGHPHQHV